LRLDSGEQGSPGGGKEAVPSREWIAMLALIEGHPNADVIIFYILASATLAWILYRHHRKTIKE
jgi:hypothetical protein